MPAERLARAVAVLQSTALPVDLADNPERTAQWLAVLGNLQQALVLLQVRPEGEGRAMQIFRRFQRMINGLPETCLTGLPSTTKLGLLRALMADIEARGSSLDLPGSEAGVLRSRLRQCRASICAMAARLQPPAEPGALPDPA